MTQDPRLVEEPATARADVEPLRPPAASPDRTAATLFAFLPPVRVRYLRALRVLADAERRFREQVRVIGVLPRAHAERMRGWRGRTGRTGDDRDPVTLQIDDGAIAARFAGAGARAASGVVVVVLLDQQERQCRMQDLDADLCADVARVLSGDYRPAIAADLAALDQFHSGAANVPPDAAVLERAMRDASWHWLPHCARLRTMTDVEFADAGAETVRRALRDLGDRPVGRARVLEQLLRRAAPDARPGWAEDALHGVLRAAPTDPVVARCGFEWFVGSGDAASASRWALACIEAEKGAADRLVAFARRLAGQDARFPRERLLALDLALCTRAEPPAEWLHDKLLLLLVELDDPAGAAHVGVRLVSALGDDARRLNSLAWRLLTEEPYRGRLGALALTAARAMTRTDGWRTYWRVDTLALACFENGLVEEAVRWQTEALESCDRAASARYRERLQHYRAALPAARPAARPGR